jgi:hypothetical protein
MFFAFARRQALRLLYPGLAVVVALSAPAAHARIASLETEHLRLLYNDVLQGYLAGHAARCFENSLAFHRRLWGYTPSERVTIMLHDGSDFADAGATGTPRNAVFIAIAPFSYAYETTPANERLNLIMSHELVHVLMQDQATGRDRFFRRLFGGKIREESDNPVSMLYGYLTSPRRNAPRWYHEGVAVFLETWMAGGLGRAQGAYDEMVFRSMVRDSARFYDPVGLEAEGIHVDFMAGVNSYLYGTRFVSYLAYVYGPDKLLQWVTRKGGSNSYFASEFHRVYGCSLDSAWSEWVAWEHDFQHRNLDSIRLYPTTPARNLAPQALGSVSRAFYDADAGTIYAAVNYPGRVAHLAAIDTRTGRIRKVCDVKGPAMYYVASLAFDPYSGTLFYTADNGELRDLVAVDANSGHTHVLLKDARIGDLVFNRADSSLWGVRHFNGLSTIVRIPAPYKDWEYMYSWPYGRDVYDLDISPDGTRLTMGLSEISGRQSLILMSTEALRRRDSSYTELFDFQNSIPANFVFTDDAKYLYGSSYYTGVSNIFRYDFAADSMDAMTNAESGFFRPLPVWDDSIIVFGYTGQGFVPAVVPVRPLEDVSATAYLGQLIAEKYEEVRNWTLPPPSSVNLDTLVTDSGFYRPLLNVRPRALYPIVQGYQDYPAYGAHVTLLDLMMAHRSNIDVTYTPNRDVPADERLHIFADYSYRSWALKFKRHGSDFYDLFGPTKRSRRGNSLALTYSRSLIKDPPRSMQYSVSLAGYSDLVRLPDYQNVPTSFNKFATFGFDVGYGNQTSSLGAVDVEKGFAWSGSVGGTWVRRKIYSQSVATLDLGTALPLNHSSVWLRNAAGYAPGDRFEPFANFYFGGFGNNWIDYRGEKRYRRVSSFPGFELNAIGGTNFVRSMLEWNLPPLRFRRVGSSALYASWIRPAVFAGALVTNVDDKTYRTTVGNIGIQLDLRMNLLTRSPLTFSVGYAMGFVDRERTRDEWMFSLKIL